MLDKNLLLGCRSFKKTEDSKSVTDFLKVKCEKCKHEIKFKLALWDISNVEAYIEGLRQENKALKKGINSLMQSRKKWKNRYYNMKIKNKELEVKERKLIEKLEAVKQKDESWNALNGELAVWTFAREILKECFEEVLDE